MYARRDTGRGWSTVHFQLTELFSGQPANIRLEAIDDYCGTDFITELTGFITELAMLTVVNGICRDIGK